VPLGLLEVQGQAKLVATEVLEPAPTVIRLRPHFIDGQRRKAQHVWAVAGFDLDDFSPVIGQQLRGERPSPGVGEVEYAHAAENGDECCSHHKTPCERRRACSCGLMPSQPA
jgi:hypothetical protein